MTAFAVVDCIGRIPLLDCVAADGTEKTPIKEHGIIFCGTEAFDKTEHYFMVPEHDIWQRQLKTEYKHWIGKYKTASSKDDWKKEDRGYKYFDTGDNNREYNLRIQFFRNRANKQIPGWYAIDGFEPIDTLIEELVNFICHRLIDKSDHSKIIGKAEEIAANCDNPGAYFSNSLLAIFFINIAYKFIKSNYFKEQIDDKDLTVVDEYELVNIQSSWSDDDHRELAVLLQKFIDSFNRLIKYLSSSYPEFHQINETHFTLDGMAGFLLYWFQVKKHIDTENLMDLSGKMLCAILMINAMVNANKIEYNEDTDRYFAVYNEVQKPKQFCFDKKSLCCSRGESENKHLYVYPKTIVLGIPPDVATMTHYIHDVCGATALVSIRMLSKNYMQRAPTVEEILGKFEALSIKYAKKKKKKNQNKNENEEEKKE